MRTQAEYTEAKEALLKAAMAVAPNGLVQGAFSKLIRDLESEPRDTTDGERHRSILTRLVGTIYDGLAYGNWIGQL